jgi:hypothetical protein
MAGLWVARALVVLIALPALALIRNPLVNALAKLGAFIATLFDRLINVMESLFTSLKSVIPTFFLPLRRLHGHDEKEQPDYFWDFLLGLLFIMILGLLSYADYELFALRVGPILFNTRAQGTEQGLSGILGIYFILTFLVLGFALSDANGSVPGGSIIFGMLRKERDRKVAQVAMLIAVIFAVVAAIILGVWTVEKTQFATQDNWLAAFFQGIFALLALLATALSVPPAIVGGLCVVVILVILIRAFVWLLGMVAWIIVSLFQKALEFLVALYDFPARLGRAMVNWVAGRFSERYRQSDKKLVEFDAEIGSISQYSSQRPFQPPSEAEPVVAKTQVAGAVQEPEAARTAASAQEPAAAQAAAETEGEPAVVTATASSTGNGQTSGSAPAGAGSTPPADRNGRPTGESAPPTVLPEVVLAQGVSSNGEVLNGRGQGSSDGGSGRPSAPEPYFRNEDSETQS